MSDTPDAPRPSWPGAPRPADPAPEPGPAPTPRWDTAPPQGPPPQGPAPMAAAEPPPHRKRRLAGIALDLKLLIAVLIGLVSVTGAVVTWRSSVLGESATDKDRQAIAETVRIEQDAANDEITLQDARSRVAAHAASLANADVLVTQAERFAASGDDQTARAARDEAEELRTLAESYLLGGTSPLDLHAYVVIDEATGLRSLDVSTLRADLEALSRARSQVDPTQTVREANRLRDESQRLDGWLVPLVSAVVLLTLAQMARQRPARLVLAGAGTVVWIASSVIAFRG